MLTNANGIENNSLLSARYRFSITELDENPKLEKQYSREVSVRQLNLKNEATRFQLLCKKYAFNDPHITPLIRKTAYVFDVLIVIVNPEGRIIAVENKKELQKEWEELKDELQKNHTGSGFEKYVHNMHLAIYNQEKLITFLESDTMYGPFFKALWLRERVDQLAQYTVMQTEEGVQLTEKTSNAMQREEYFFKENDLIEYLKIKDNIQYEIVCLDLEKV